MRIQAAQMLKNPTRREITDELQNLVDVAMGGLDEEMDQHFEIVIVRTAQPRQSPLAEAAGIPLIPRG